MSHKSGRLLLAGFLLAAALAWAVAGCAGGASPYASTPATEIVRVPPPPTLTLTFAVSSGTSAAASTTAEAGVKPTVIAAKLGVSVVSNQAQVTFPDKIVFTMTGNSSNKIKDILLVYGTSKRTLAPETSNAKPEFKEGTAVDARWEWALKKTGSIPPGTVINWKWSLTDFDGNQVEIPQQILTYSDTRFTWESRKYDEMDIYWHDQSQTIIDELLKEVDIRLSTIQLGVDMPANRKPKVFVYRSSQELRDAVLFEQQWTGALAFPAYNIILTAVDPSILEWAKVALPHEITHLLVGEAVFGPFGNLPTWINEGLASYAEGDMSQELRQALDQALKNNRLISLRSLSGTFPADSAQALLAYAESGSLIKYLIGQGGWEKMRLLLATFKEGTTQDGALSKVYGLDVAGLESQWKLSLAAKP